MIKYIALLLAAAAIIVSACSSTGIEYTADDYTEPDPAATEAETADPEPETVPRAPEHEGYVEYKKLHMGEDPVYDRENNLILIYFEDKNVWYTEEAICYVAYISDTAANSIAASPVMDAYPDMIRDDGNYCGIALKMDEKIPVGTYEIVVTFDAYICTFDWTVQ